MWADDEWLQPLSNDTWHTFDKRESRKTQKKSGAACFFSSLFFFFGVQFNVIAVMTHGTGARFTVVTTRSHGSLSSWCHLPLGMHAKQQHPGPDCLLEHLYTSIISSHARTDTHARTHAGLSHALISRSRSEGFSEPCGVFNMEIGFEPHLHRSAHLRAKLRYRWQGKWTINSL